jgi:hypothetical protein
MDQKQTLFERSEFRLFPIFCNAQNVMAQAPSPIGQVCGRLSFAYFFFGEAKKSKWPPGHPRLASTKRNIII